MPDAPSRAVAVPCGAWPSPISARSVAQGGRRRFDDLAALGDSACWLERRPEEGGRNVLVCLDPDGGARTLTPEGFDVRSRVHEYGGGAFCLLGPAGVPAASAAGSAVGARACHPSARVTGARTGSRVTRSASPGRRPASGEPRSGEPEPIPHAFVNFSDQRVYLAAGGAAVPVTPDDGARYADLVFDPHRHRLLAVQERPAPGGGDEIAALVAIPLPADPPAAPPAAESSRPAEPPAPAEPPPPAEPPAAAESSPAAEPPPPVELVSGADFFSSPRLSPDGSRLAWLSWNHPDMPWDATALHLADLDGSGLPRATRLVAGGDPDRPEAVQQPNFDVRGRLVFLSDGTGWWNLYRAAVLHGSPAGSPDGSPVGAGSQPASGEQRGGEPDPIAITPLCPRDAEFGRPHWVFGISTYAHVAGGIVAACCEQGVWGLVFLPDGDGDGASRPQPIPIPAPYTSIDRLRSASAPDAGRHPGGQTGGPAVGRSAATADLSAAAPDAGQHPGGAARAPAGGPSSAVIFLGAAPDRPAEIVRVRLSDSAEPRLDVLVRTGPAPDPRYLSRGRPIDFPSAGGRRAYAFFYPPKNDDARPPRGEKPPLVVKIHGGPTSNAEHLYNTEVQYWTSRGFAVVDVNYGGSTGYGRAYRESLRGRWGIVDVEDCAAAAEALAARGEVDPGKLLIRGGSAGGYTTLAALAFRDTFAAGASHYGVADLAGLVRDTHKFESRYLDRLVGPYPERTDLYSERSPLEARDRFSCPVIFFQGDEDRIVPPNQAEAMVEALRAKGVRVEYHLFEGEQHGFRQAGNIVRALEAELAFYGEVLGFEPP